MIKRISFYLLLVAVNTLNAQTMQVSRSAIRWTVEDLIKAHNEHDREELTKIYDVSIRFDGKDFLKRSFILQKLSRLSPTDGEKKISSPSLDLTAYSSGIIRCDFDVSRSRVLKEEAFRYYLLIRKNGNDYNVCGEGLVSRINNLDLVSFLGSGIGINDTTSITLQRPARSNYKPVTFNVVVPLIIVFTVTMLLFWHFKTKRKTAPSLSQAQPKPASRDKNNLDNDGSKPTQPTFDSKPSNSINNQHTKEKNEDNYGSYGELSVNAKKGYEFEQYVVEKFKRRAFVLLEWRGDKRSPNVFPKSNSYPDLEFEFSHNGLTKNFLVECKYRSHLSTGNIFEVESDQISRYRAFGLSRGIDVYLILGLGGKPSGPKRIFLVPLDKEIQVPFSQEFLKSYEKKGKQIFFFDDKLGKLT